MPSGQDDVGETLLEVVIAILFIGLAVVALVGGIGTAATLSTNHNALTEGDIALKNAAEAVKRATYAAGSVAAKAAYTSALPPGSGAVVVTVRCGPPAVLSTYDAATAMTCSSATDTGLQLVTVLVEDSARGVQESTTVIKRAS